MLPEERRLGIIEPQSLPVLGGPLPFVGNLYFVNPQDAKFTRSLHRNRQPAPAFASADLVAIGEAVFLELHVVEHDVRIRYRDAMEVTQPRQVGRLINRNDHVLSDDVLSVLYR